MTVISNIQCSEKTSSGLFRLGVMMLCFFAAPGLLVAASLRSPACLGAPPLAPVSGVVAMVSDVATLHQVISNLQPGTTILLEPGDYQLNQTLYIQQDDITIRGNSDRCDAVNLIGQGMENANYGQVPHGIWTNAANLKVFNLTIREVYFHPIQFDPSADAPWLYNLRLLDAGEQFIKGSSGGFGNGVNDGVVEFTIMAYTNSPPVTDHGGGGSGYTNGVDIHGGDGWLIRNNLFQNFHTPDDSDNLWNPAILMWNGASNTVAENNVFIDVDRAIAFGLVNRTSGADHTGGIIRNNMVYSSPGLFSASRRNGSDGLIIVWDSPQTQVLHNTILSNQNQRLSIEMRFDTTGSQVINNLNDASIGSRNGATFTASGNLDSATQGMFLNPATGDLHLRGSATTVMDQVTAPVEALFDHDGESRSGGPNADVGADEYNPNHDVIFVEGFNG
ncbi:hypothetical protein ACFODZ_11650 [Marinicella sediminis]|uniref:Right handed beta helix domain-containing protein n=1 Tax=Marinicella sediminis TaxID=1792834 RepID=A0ABV7J9T2_9GAMM|nr:hypothetical protein [Marinicella sediminis]